MPRTVYVNGRYLPYAEAGVHVEDRGFQFADAVYEVCEVRGGCLVDEARHLARLARSLGELEIDAPMSDGALSHVMRETIRRNRVCDGVVYVQVTRGAAPRDFPFPADAEPTLVCIARAISPAQKRARAEAGIGVKTMADPRWARCDIKTVMLLPACLAKEAARQEGASEVWFIDNEGMITEGGSSNAWIVTRKGEVVTRSLSSAILPGVTRASLIDMLKAEGMALCERPFSREEALCAAEAFVTSASATILPVVRIDGRDVGDGRPGPVAHRLRTNFHRFAAISAGY